MVKSILKNVEQKLCYGLTHAEFSCKCKHVFCTMTILNEKLFTAYEGVRKFLNLKLIINCGYRCPAHNFDVLGAALSQHMTGSALDISRENIEHLTDEEIEFVFKKFGFTYIKFYKTFIHVDVR